MFDQRVPRVEDGILAAAGVGRGQLLTRDPDLRHRHIRGILFPPLDGRVFDRHAIRIHLELHEEVELRVSGIEALPQRVGEVGVGQGRRQRAGRVRARPTMYFTARPEPNR